MFLWHARGCAQADCIFFIGVPKQSIDGCRLIVLEEDGGGWLTWGLEMER